MEIKFERDISRQLKECEVEKGVIVPNVKFNKPDKYWVDLLNKMEIGDSVFIKNTTPQKVCGIYSAAHRQGKRVAIRTLDGGVRIWRRK